MAQRPIHVFPVSDTTDATGDTTQHQPLRRPTHLIAPSAPRSPRSIKSASSSSAPSPGIPPRMLEVITCLTIQDMYALDVKPRWPPFDEWGQCERPRNQFFFALTTCGKVARLLGNKPHQNLVSKDASELWRAIKDTPAALPFRQLAEQEAHLYELVLGEKFRYNAPYAKKGGRKQKGKGAANAGVKGGTAVADTVVAAGPPLAADEPAIPVAAGPIFDWSAATAQYPDFQAATFPAAANAHDQTCFPAPLPQWMPTDPLRTTTPASESVWSDSQAATRASTVNTTPSTAATSVPITPDKNEIDLEGNDPQVVGQPKEPENFMTPVLAGSSIDAGTVSIAEQYRAL